MSSGEQVLDVQDAQDAQAPPGERRGRRRERRVRKITITVFVLVAAGTAAVATLDPGGGDDGPGAGDLPPRTAEVRRQTLKDIRSEDGKLGYGTAVSLSGRLPGTFTRLPKAGTEVSRGQALYTVDNRPVVLMYGTLPAYRLLREGVEGPDVKQLEANLAALGYTGFTVDEEYSGYTARAVERWQEDLGLPETGTVELGRVVFTAGAVRIDGVEAAAGDEAAPGQKVLAYTSTGKAVTLELGTDDQHLAAKGRKVGVRLPDSSTVNGRVTEATTVLKPAEQGQEAKTVLAVVVAPADAKARKAAGAYGQAGVHVDFTSGERANVLTVPVAALLALAEGGFGVEVVRGREAVYVPVTTGLFAGGRVEIAGDGITEGTRVGVPK
ncbi:peptidoglycan-binding protein [Streptomyces polyrhachis]|uniref:Peptidoglycan-binding protein n=1 Tax=Streptomyces polyrhachis TaxID=1282885 RepID=A0ABW2GIA0_9ACTN